MRSVICAALVAGLSVGCVDDPSVGSASWSASPSGDVPGSLFVVAWSEPEAGGWIVRTADYDGEIHCSRVKSVGGGGLTIHLNDRAVASVGEVPITSEPQNPDVASAQLTLGSRVYTGGTVSITDLDGTIRATFDATADGATLTGDFYAVRCE